MSKISVLSYESMGKSFIPEQFIPKGKDEYYLRNTQATIPKSGWRHLKSDEIERLVMNNNFASSWDDILVTDVFEPKLIKNNKFYGLVRIGNVHNGVLQYHDLRLPIGITNSIIISCDIGNDVAIHDVSYLAHYIIGNLCILFNIQEMCTTNHAKFGNGIIKDGENEDVRVCLEVMNETGCRSILPFDGMIPGDAFMWAKYIDDKKLQERLVEITQNTFDNRRGYYGIIGSNNVIKNSLILKDVKIGDFCYIKGASKLKNITINSSESEPTQIGEGVILVNGIVGYGCHIFYSCTAVRFILGSNSNLKYGARVVNSFLGDNSTISCCEVLNNLIFPAHEQHHNNSFLVASVLMGQTNLAAGATIGSNHNSRTNDNEIQAGRGFWPGLCSSIKHSCKFASFTLLSKADYPSEMDIPLPFSLINNNASKDELEVMPAFWWMYNMYALSRNAWKYKTRDKRITKTQNIEFSTFAPDSMEEVILGRKLLEKWTAKAYLLKNKTFDETLTDKELRKQGKILLNGKKELIADLDIFGENMEKGKRKVRLLKVYEAYHAYGDMLTYYAVTNIFEYMLNTPNATFESMTKNLGGNSNRQKEWINLGGQLMMTKDFDKIRTDIVARKLDNWKEIHNRYNKIWEHYQFDKQRHAYLSLCYLLESSTISLQQWEDTLLKSVDIQQFICDQVYLSRKKDYENHFRKSTFRNDEEMLAAVGDIEDNSFIILVREETLDFRKNIQELLEQLRKELTLKH